MKDLKDTLSTTLAGTGLAAPQIGVLKKAFLINYNGRSRVFINPVMINEWGRDVAMKESCLSISKIRSGGLFAPVSVTRKENIRIRFYDENWKKFEIDTGGFLARIIQHEYDHLIGYICIDRNLEQKNKKTVKTFEQFTKNNY